MQTYSQPEIPPEWKRKRSSTYFIAILDAFSIGFTFTIIQSTLLTYLKEGLHLEHVELYYGLNCSGIFVTVFVCGIPLSTWFDEHRRLRLYAVAITVISLFGNIVYMFPIPNCTIAGSILTGAAYIQRSAISSEILRVYPEDEVQVRYTLTLVSYGIGDALGPLCAKLLEGTDFWVGRLHITYGNSICLVLITFSILRLILTIFFAHNLSLEFDLKAVEQNEGTCVDMERSYLDRMKAVFSVDILLLFAHQAYSGFWSWLLPRLLPLMIETLDYNKTVLDMCYAVAGAVMAMVALLLMLPVSSTSGVLTSAL